MRWISHALPATLLGAMLVVPMLGQAQATNEAVSIPRSRLLELERKAAELDAIRGVLKQSEQENENLKNQRDAAEKAKAQAEQEKAQAVAAKAQLPPVHISPPIESLPPLQSGQVVQAQDLGSYFATDAAAAQHRFQNARIQVQGEIAGFDRAMFSRTYQILLKTAAGGRTIRCNFSRADRFSTVYTISNGSQIVGLQGETEIPLARAGETVVISGVCKGLKKDGVELTACTLGSRP